MIDTECEWYCLCPGTRTKAIRYFRLGRHDRPIITGNAGTGDLCGNTGSSHPAGPLVPAQP